MHPLEDEEMKNIVTQYMPYDAGTEEQKAAELVAMLLRDIDVPEAVRSFIAKYDNNSDEGLEKLRKSLIKKSDFSLVIGSDLYAHPRAKQIAKILALLEKYADFNVVCVPPAGNAMGVSLICELDDEATGQTIGYNVQADFTLSALGNGDLDMPALNQQEGTLTTNDKRVVPMNVAQPYGGYVLNDIANALGLNAEYTVDYTKALPTEKGFEAQEFDTLPDYFDTIGTEHRGYLLTEQSTTVEEDLEDVTALDGFDGALVYHCNPKEQFSAFTHLCEPLAQEACLLGSTKFAQEMKLSEDDLVSFVVDGVTFERVFKIDTSMRGTIALNPSYDMGLSAPLVSSYRFSQAEIMKVGS
jgi:NADH-quinone oxidoreductase subunit G